MQPRQTERQITAQMNEQKNQKKRELQGKEKQQQTKITQPKPSKSSTGKNSNLGIIALVLSILGCTFWIGIVLAIIDLCQKNGKKKSFSIASIIICVLWIGIAIGAIGNSGSNKETGTGAKVNVSQQREYGDSSITNTQGKNQTSNPGAIDEDLRQNNHYSENKSSYENETDNSSNQGNNYEPSLSKRDFITLCEEIPYKTIARNPDNYIGTKIKLTVKVTQILQGGWLDDNEYYRVYTNDEYNMWLGDEYFMYDDRVDKSPKILEDDVLIIYGECDGTTTVKRALSNTNEDVVAIRAKYIDILEEYADDTQDGQDNYLQNDTQYNDGLTAGQRNAINSAKSYLEWSAFSYEGLIDQLEYEKYSHEDAVYAADNCGADWYEQAVKKARSYLEYSPFSRDGLIEQLEYEGFTYDQAVYGAEQNGY